MSYGTAKLVIFMYGHGWFSHADLVTFKGSSVFKWIPVLMIMASHQTFSVQFKHLSFQTKFGQTNFPYIINGKVIEFLTDKPVCGQFSILIISTEILFYVFYAFLQYNDLFRYICSFYYLSVQVHKLYSNLGMENNKD